MNWTLFCWQFASAGWALTALWAAEVRGNVPLAYGGALGVAAAIVGIVINGLGGN